VQLELPWALGPRDGRYVLRRHAGEDAESVLVLRTLGAPQRRTLRRRRARATDPEPEPIAVPTTRATLIDAAPFEGEEDARSWLDGADAEALVADALRAVNRVLYLHRVASADNAARDVGRSQALAVRIGYGAGEQVADGRWTRALTLPDPRTAGRASAALLRPQERLAAMLSGRDVALACEELTLRAREDADAGRTREAALTLRGALDAALAELVPWTDRADIGRRLEELRELRGGVDAVAARALESGLEDDEAATIEQTLSRLEAALRARTASGLD
jgi:hypothetical protein